MRLYLFTLGTVIANGAPIQGYLVRLDDGTNVLIDTGYRPGTFGEDVDPQRAVFHVADDQFVDRQLEQLGLSPQQIDDVICTHFDPDHAGYVDIFPRATIVVQRAQLAAARGGDEARFGFTRAAWSLPDERYRLVDGDTELLPGIELIETSGHAIGQQSVLLRLPKTGPVLLPIDAMGREDFANPEGRAIGQFDVDGEQARRSARKLVDLAKREGVQLIIYGHDAEQWATLKHSPAYYE
jgi:N-acyl homoserine lactone hydrolase